jgi:REP-associated tyrosine transposase
MARRPRIQTPGLYHLMGRAVARRELFHDDVDRIVLLRQLARMIVKRGWSCHAYCLMTTHYHLVVRTYDHDLAVGMHFLQSAYARHFNQRHDELGHVFFRRYHSVLIERESHLIELNRYLALNPVRAGLCRAPEEWPWSSYAAAAGLVTSPTFLTTEPLLSLLGVDVERSRTELRTLVAEEAVDRS